MSNTAQILDVFTTLSKGHDLCLTELLSALQTGQIKPSMATEDGMIEKWVHDFVVPGNDGVFRLKLVIERTTEQGNERLPIILKSENNEK